MSDLIAGVLDGLAGLNPTALYLLAGLFTALETSVGIGLLVPGDGVVLLAGQAVVGAALAVVLTARAGRSQAQRGHGGAPPTSRVQSLEPRTVDPLGGGRHERHDTAA